MLRLRPQHRLPLHPTLDRLAALVEEAGIPVQADVLTYDGQDFEDSDNDLVNRYLWEGFLPEGSIIFDFYVLLHVACADLFPVQDGLRQGCRLRRVPFRGTEGDFVFQ